MTNPILKHFDYQAEPPQIGEIIRPFAKLAWEMDQTLPDGPEKSVGLRKLLEAKDCMVRAKSS